MPLNHLVTLEAPADSVVRDAARKDQNIARAIAWLEKEVLPYNPDLTMDELARALYGNDGGMNGWWSSTKDFFSGAGKKVSNWTGTAADWLGSLSDSAQKVSKMFSDLGEFLTGQKRAAAINWLMIAVVVLVGILLLRGLRRRR